MDYLQMDFKGASMIEWQFFETSKTC